MTRIDSSTLPSMRVYLVRQPNLYGDIKDSVLGRYRGRARDVRRLFKGENPPVNLYPETVFTLLPTDTPTPPHSDVTSNLIAQFREIAKDFEGLEREALRPTTVSDANGLYAVSRFFGRERIVYAHGERKSVECFFEPRTLNSRDWDISVFLNETSDPDLMAMQLPRSLYTLASINVREHLPSSFAILNGIPKNGVFDSEGKLFEYFVPTVAGMTFSMKGDPLTVVGVTSELVKTQDGLLNERKRILTELVDELGL